MSDRTRLPRILLLSTFTGIGLLLLSAAAWMAVNNLVVMRTHEHARAEVVRSARIGSGSGKGLTFYAVEVRYDGPRGRRTAHVDRSTAHYETGEILSVYYMPKTAYKVVAGGFMGMWFYPLVLGIPGLVMVFFGLRPKDLRQSGRRLKVSVRDRESDIRPAMIS